VRKGGFVCSVSGKRRGKGSSREQSPYAELMAGIRVVIAENIERIYNENCQNLGVLTSTDFSLIERIRGGEEIELAAFTDGCGPITRDIIEYGGLFEYNVARLQGKVTSRRSRAGGRCAHGGDGSRTWAIPRGARPARRRREGPGAVTYGLENAAAQADGHVAPTNERGPDSARRAVGRVHRERQHGRRPMTIAEKIFASRWVWTPRRAVRRAVGAAGRQRLRAHGLALLARVRLAHGRDLLRAQARRGREGERSVDDPDVPRPPDVPARGHAAGARAARPARRGAQLKDKQEEFAKKQGVIYYGERLGIRLGSEAICHSKMLEEYAEPGRSSSARTRTRRTPAPSAASRSASAPRPSSTRGSRRTCASACRRRSRSSSAAEAGQRDGEGLHARDPAPSVHPDGHAIGQIIEYAGEAVEALSIDERATMTNMAAEVGAFTGHRGAGREGGRLPGRGARRGPRPRGALCEGLFSDDDAEYVKVIEIDASAIRPMVALPGDPGNGLYIDELGAEPIRIDVAYAGSCTAGKKEDMDMYAAVLRPRATRACACTRT
jgi:hypothetical protein